jgi:hypothetical protein
MSTVPYDALTMYRMQPWMSEQLSQMLWTVEVSCRAGIA